MKIQNIRKLAFPVLLAVVFVVSAAAQDAGMIKRTTTKTDNFDLSPGGTVSVVGAPNGSITIEGWRQNIVEVTAEIEMQAATTADLDRLSKITGFMTEESLSRIGIISIGTHDKKYLKKADKKLPKALIGLPFRIDYTIKVPSFCDIEIDGGTGDLSISGVDGQMRVNFLNSNAKFELVGGGINATIGSGEVDVRIPTRSWRGRFAEFQLATGTMNVFLPPDLNADVDGTILRTGKIENAFEDLKPRARKVVFTEKSVAAKAGNGGISLKFTVGDGTLNIKPMPKPE